MCRCPTLGVRAAYDFFAFVPASGNAVGLHTVCGRRTVFVDLTFDRRVAAFFVRIADRPERTQAFERTPGVVAPGARSARRRFAKVQHVTSEIRVARVTGLTVTNLNGHGEISTLYRRTRRARRETIRFVLDANISTIFFFFFYNVLVDDFPPSTTRWLRMGCSPNTISCTCDLRRSCRPYNLRFRNIRFCDIPRAGSHDNPVRNYKSAGGRPPNTRRAFRKSLRRIHPDIGSTRKNGKIIVKTFNS